MENPKAYFAKKFNLNERDIVPEFIPLFSTIDVLASDQKEFFQKYKAEIKQVKFQDKKEAMYHGAAATFMPSLVVLIVFSVLYFTWTQQTDFQLILDYNAKYPNTKDFSLFMQNVNVEHLTQGDFVRLEASKNAKLIVGKNYTYEGKTNSILIPLGFK